MTQPIWSPNYIHHTPFICQFIGAVNYKHKQLLQSDNYAQLHQWSIENKEDFWHGVWDECGIIGDKGDVVIEATNKPPYERYFPNGKINYAENMLSHWKRNPDANAIIHRHQDEEDTIITGQNLCDQVSIWQQALERAGIVKNDIVGVYLPNIPLTDIILIAASNIGAILCTAGMEMGTEDLIGRFGSIKPKILITAETYNHGKRDISRIKTIAEVKNRIKSIKATVLVDATTGETDEDFLKNISAKDIQHERHEFNHPLYILFSSGSTGVPKCFVHSTGGVLLKHVSEYRLQCDINAGDVSFYHATPSWMMWNWSASALVVGATLLKHSGDPFYPYAGSQLRFTAQHGCTHHGTAAPVIMGWKAEGLDVTKNMDLTPLRSIMYTGAVLPDQGFDYLQKHIKKGVHVSGVSGGTDVVGCFLSGNPITPVYAGQIAAPCLGVDLQILDKYAKPTEGTEPGELSIIGSFPSMPLYFFGNKKGDRYHAAYYDFYAWSDKKIWRHGDSIQRTDEGQLLILGRSDGTLNQNGVRIGSVTIYNQLEPFKDQILGATAVDFMRPDTKQAITILFLALANHENGVPHDLAKAIKAAIKENVGPYSVPTEIIAAPDVLKTKNGKLAEVVTKNILAAKPIDNPNLYGENLVEFYQTITSELMQKYT